MHWRLGVCAAVVLLSSAIAAIAADLPLLVRKAPAPITAYDWTGIYVGGHLAAGFSYRSWTLVDGGISEAGDAAMIGGQLGFNYQIGKFVLGAETDVSWGNLKDETFCPDGSNTCWTRQTWLAAVTGRMGYAFDPALFYVKAGAAFTHADYFKTSQVAAVLDEGASAAEPAGLSAPEWNTRCGEAGRSSWNTTTSISAHACLR